MKQSKSGSKWCWIAKQDKLTPYFKLSLEIGKRTYHVGGLRVTMGSIKKLVKGGIVFVHNK